MRHIPAISLEPSADPSPVRPSLLLDLENRQEEVLRQLDELNRRIEHALSQERLSVDATKFAG